MMIATFALLIIAGLYLAILILTIVFSINAKSTAGRVGSILAGLFLLLVVPSLFLVATFTLRMESNQEGPGSSGSTMTVATGSKPSPRSVDATVPATPRGDVPAAVASNPERPVPPPIVELAEEPSAGEQTPGQWRTTGTEAFTANVYPSYSAAIRPLTAGLRERLAEKQVLQRDENDDVIDPQTIVVSASGPSVESLVPPITEQLSKLFPGVVVRSVGTVPAEPTENQLSVHLIVSAASSQPATWDRQQRIENGLLTCTMQSAQHQTSFQAFVTEKPWVESLDQFVSMYPRRNFVVGYSGELQSSEGQARKQALSDAVRQAAIDFRGKPYAIIDERHVIDRFAQRLSRSYGDVWREAVLVEVPDSQQVSNARMTAAEAFQRSSMGKLSKAVGMLVLVIVTVVMCLGLNWVTQGYYRSQVMLGLASVVIMGFLLTVMFIS
ncbi:hypothetical protein Enr13x_51300 [Stieleria neptunia]|uniref:Uncharacterized protein n=1 Tax=Stieleria neptunia TaxID=2527979 RepID=A0A518HWM0_9BACT|nr:hypothetical protein [Stieleria neptunia]QDV45255.1 hypothetical protein Enr13x_51300 [Stieleria neptunia]